MRIRYASGFTYIGLLLVIAFMGLGMGMATELWQTVAQREKEKELLFIGHEFRQALNNYRDSDNGDGTLPAKLEDLLRDTRAEDEVKRYLRKIYVDPMTGAANWGLILDEDGGIQGIYSQSTAVPIKNMGFSKDDVLFLNKQSYTDWKFILMPEGEES
jgi:type II secretory pathway pseudopilin PulG